MNLIVIGFYIVRTSERLYFCSHFHSIFVTWLGSIGARPQKSSPIFSSQLILPLHLNIFFLYLFKYFCLWYSAFSCKIVDSLMMCSIEFRFIRGDSISIYIIAPLFITCTRWNSLSGLSRPCLSICAAYLSRLLIIILCTCSYSLGMIESSILSTALLFLKGFAYSMIAAVRSALDLALSHGTFSLRNTSKYSAHDLKQISACAYFLSIAASSLSNWIFTYVIPGSLEISHGRNAGYPAPPAQTRRCGFLASGSSDCTRFRVRRQHYANTRCFLVTTVIFGFAIPSRSIAFRKTRQVKLALNKVPTNLQTVRLSW